MNKERDEKLLKSWLKKKITITTGTVVAFLITGSIVNTPIYGAVNIGSTNGDTISNGSANGPGVSIGGDAKTQSGSDVSIGESAGKDSNSTGNSVAIGKNSRVGDQTVNQSIAIGGGNDPGQGAWAKGDQSISIGGNTRSDGHSSVAIGGDDLDKVATQEISYVNAEDKRVTGNIKDAMQNLTGINILSPQYSNTMSGHGAVALGVKAVAGHLSLAIGTAATAGAIGTNENIEYKAVNTVAIGSGATAMLDNAIAIGGGAKADKSSAGTKQTKAQIKSIEYTWNGGDKISDGDIVSFGSAGFERQLKNVAPGAVSDKSTDAINGSQLFGIAKNITSENHLKFLGDDGHNDPKKVINLSLERNRLNIVGGADTTKLSDENIGVVYESGYNKDDKGKDLETDDKGYQEGKLKIKLAKELKDLKSAEFKNDAGDVSTISGNGLTITPNGNTDKNVSITKDGINAGGNTISNVAGNLKGAKKDTTAPIDSAKAPNTTDATQPKYVNTHNVATVGDVLQAGWNLQEKGVAKDFVKPYDTVNFVNGINTTALVTTSDDRTTNNVTYNVTGLPVTYTTADGTPVSKIGDKYYKVNDQGQPVDADGDPVTKFDKNGVPLGEDGQPIPEVNITKNPLTTSVVNPKAEAGKKGTTTPTTISNVEGNLKGAKTNTTAPITEATAPNTTNATKPKYVNPHNAATVGDVLQAGWNLQGNGTAVDFVKPYDTVNFLNGINTTALVTTSDDGTTNNVTYNVTGLPVTYTTADGKPVSKIGDKYYKVNAQGQPLDANGDPVTKFNKDGVPLGKDGHPIPDVDITAHPLTTSVVNPKADGSKTGTTTPITISNVEGNLNGAKKDTTVPTTNAAAPTNVDAIKNNAATVGDVLNAGWNLQGNGLAKDFVKPYDTVNFVDGENTKVVVETDKDGKVSTIKVNTDTKKITDNVPFEYTVKDPTDGTTKTVVKATDGKFYEPANVNPDGTVKSGKSPVLDPAANPNNKELEIKAKDKAPITNVDSGLKNYTDAPKAGLRDLSNTTATPDSNVATVGDLRNMGWVVSSDKTTDNLGTAYSEVVKNANEVKFVGTGAATVSGKTDAKGVRTITVDTTKLQSKDNTPFEYAIKDPANGTTTVVEKATDGKYYDKNDLNSDGTPKAGVTAKLDPTNANDPNKDNLVIKAKGTDPQIINNVKGNLSETRNVADANNQITTSQSAPTDRTINNNTATVGDVLNSGWNLKANNTAVDFVKPYDTVEFINGANTKVIATTDGTVSKIQVNTVGLPVSYTKADGTPVVKDADGKYYEAKADGTVDKTKEITDPSTLSTSLVTPGANGTTATTKPSTLNNVKSGLENHTGKTGTETPKNVLRDLTNTKVSDNTAATVGDLRNMGWVVSSDKTTDNLGTAYSEVVKNANEVKFVGTGAATVSGKTDAKGVRTVTVDVTVPDVEKGTIESDTGDNKGKVKSKVGDGDKFTTVDTVENAINSAAWKATSGTEGSGAEAEGHTKSDAEIKAGDTVTFKAGDNLKIKQDGKNFIYSLNPELTNLSKVEVKDATGNSVVTTPTGTTTTDGTNTTTVGPTGTTTKDKDGNETKVTKDGVTITPGKDDPVNPGKKIPDIDKAVSLTKDGLNNGGNAITNVRGNLPKTHSDTKDLDGTTVVTPTTLQAKPDNIKNIVNNAATVGDVLNAGWNLQGNGKAVDFVKPYDTVNFVDGIGTTVEAKADEKGTTSTIKINTVMQYTDKDGNPVKKADDDKYYPLNEQGEPDKTKPAVKDPQVSLVNAEPKNGKTATTTPTQLGNVANGAGVYNDKVDDKGNPLTEVNGKYYTADQFENGKLKANASDTTPNATNSDKFKGLSNLTNAPDSNVATVGDIKNLGWVVSSDKTTGNLGTAYNDQVRNANEVKFVGKGTATVSGKTVDGVRTITVEVNDQVSTNNSKLPVVYTISETKDGNTSNKQVYPNKVPEIGADGNPVKNPEGTVKMIDGFTTTPEGVTVKADGTIDPAEKLKIVDSKATPVNTSVNGPEGTDKATTLSNVKGNLPQVKDGDKKAYDVNGNPIANKNNTAAPITAEEAADIVKKAGNNAATVGDVLNAGWNLQGNGKAVDFVKPYDTVNFVDGIGTTVEAKADEKGTTSTIKINTVMQYTDKDGNPVKKADDDKYYPLNEQGEPDKTKPAVKDPQVSLVNAEPKNGKTATTTPTQLGNVANGAGVYNDKVDDKGNPLTEVNGKYYTADQFENGKLKANASDTTPNATNSDKFKGLSNLTNAPDSNVATVGDIKNLGWIVSSDKATGSLGDAYADSVKHANEVKFVGKNGIQVSGKTDNEGVRTLTFEMEAGEVTPTEITKADGTKLVKVGDKAYKPEDIGTDGKPKQGKDPVGTVAKDGNVYATDSVIDSNGNVYPAGTTLTNGVAPAGTATATPIATNKPNNGSKFVTGNQVADAIEKSGFVVGKNNKALSATDFKNEDEKVNPNDELRFADGRNTNVKLATKEVIDASGKVKTVTTVKVDVVDLPVKYTDADGNIVKKGEDEKYYKVTDLADKVYINGKYYPANSVVDKDGKVYPAGTTLINGLAPTGTQEAPESSLNEVAAPKTNLVNPNAGKNKAGDPTQLGNVANGAKTFEAKADANGNPLIKVGTDYYTADQLDKNGQPKEGQTAKTPTQDIKMGKDGKWYNATDVVNGTPKADAVPVATPVNPGKAGLVDFSNSTPTNAATVGDLQNMGWVVSTSDTGYNDQVRNTNKVDFKQGTGIKISGETTADGTRQITIGLDTGKVTNEVTITKPNGKKVNAIKVTQPDGTVKYYEKDKDGKADLKKEVPVGTEANDNKVTADDGSRVVTGNAVATAIGESGWNVGKANAKDVTKAFETEAKLHDKVNPNDDVKFVDGNNTTVSMVTIDSKDENGTKKATTYIKTDINKDIHIDSVTVGGKITNKTGDTMMLGKDGNYYPAGSVENNGNYYPAGSIVNNGNVYPAGSVVSKNGNVYPAGTTLDENGEPKTAGTVPVSPITTALTPTAGKDVKVAPKTELSDNGIKVTPAKPLDEDKVDPNKVVNLTNNGLNNGGNNITNVKSNLPQVNDGAKKVYDVNGNPIANKNNIAAPITAADAADIIKKAGNNAATVGDVLNAGWNLQENGSDKDFVKPYDTVNFVDGTNTKVTVKTNEDGTKSNVQINLVGLPIAFADKDGNRVVQGVKDGKIVYHKMLSDGTASKELVDPKNVQVTNVNPTDAKINTVGTPGATINNVAPAEVSPTSTQAVNGSQLYQVAQEINNVNNKVDKLGDRVNKGLAGAAAMSGIEFMEIGINQATVAAAVGGYRGTHAVAVGIEAAPTENTRVNAKASLTPGARTESMYSVGASYRFNWK